MLKWINNHLIRILLPIFIIAVAIGAMNSDQEKIGCTDTTTGVIIKMNIRTRHVDDGKYDMHESIRFHTPTIRYIVDGKTYEKEFSGSIEPIGQVGQEVQILYNPDKPKVSILPEEHDEYARRYTNGGTILWGIACIVLFIASICIGTWMDNNRQRNALEKQAKKERAIEPQERKKQKTGWFAPLVVVFLFAILDMKVSGQNLNFESLLVFKFGAYTGLLTFYNAYYCAQKKPDFREVILISPFVILILGFLLPAILIEAIFLPLILLVLGSESILLAIGVSSQENKKKGLCTVRTNATVVGNRKEYTTSREIEDIPLPTYRPILSFYVDGEEKEVAYDHGLPRPMEVGRRIELLYNPKNAEEFCFSDEKAAHSVRAVPVIFLISGIIVCIVGIGAVFL